MNSRNRIIFIGEAVSLAHVTRPLVLAKSLSPEKYDIHFACDPRYKELIISVPGIRYWPIQSIPSKVFIKAANRNEYAYTQKDLRLYINQEMCLLQKIKPSLVIGDYRYTLSTSAELLKIPFAAIANMHYSPYRKIVSSTEIIVPKIRSITVKLISCLFPWILPFIERQSLVDLNNIRKEYNLTPMKDLGDLLTRANYTLYADLPGLVKIRILPSHHVVLGPILWEPDVPCSKWWQSFDFKRPLIYITLGSTGIASKLPQILHELSKLPVNLAVSTAKRIRLQGLPPNVYLADYLPGTEICRHSTVVLCNGGSATVYQALSQARPVVGICSNSDQYMTMKGVDKAGAGVGFSALKVDPIKIRNILSTVIEERRYHLAAASLALELKSYNAPKRFKNFIEGLYGDI